jgi:hypothetical protein
MLMRRFRGVIAVAALATAAVACGPDRTVVRRETVTTTTVPQPAPVVIEKHTVVEPDTVIVPSEKVYEQRRTTIERDAD